MLASNAQDDKGNMLPMEEDIVALFVCHDGMEVWLQSPTGDVTDSLNFLHYVGSSAEAITTMFRDRMVRVHRELKYDYQADMWGYFNTLYFA